MDDFVVDRAAADRARILRTFVDDNGYIRQLPAKTSKRLVVLDYVAQAFEIGRRYPERDVNETLIKFHEDYASLRRHLVDAGFLEREDNVYWRSGGTVDV